MNYFESMCKLTGYKPITTYQEDFSTLDETAHIPSIRAYYDQCMKEIKGDYKKLTELVIVLNWKGWSWNQDNEQLSKVYFNFFERCDEFACNNLIGEELTYFFQTVD